MIGMIIAIIANIALAVMCAYFAAQTITCKAYTRAWKDNALIWQDQAQAWVTAVSPAHLKAWDKYEELSTGEKIAVHEYASYLLRSVGEDAADDDETTELPTPVILDRDRYDELSKNAKTAVLTSGTYLFDNVGDNVGVYRPKFYTVTARDGSRAGGDDETEEST